MLNRMKFYIDGAWVDPAVKKTVPVVNPATEEKMYDVAVGSKADVDKAVAAARKAFETFSVTTRDGRADSDGRARAGGLRSRASDVDAAGAEGLSLRGEGRLGRRRARADRRDRHDEPVELAARTD